MRRAVRGAAGVVGSMARWTGVATATVVLLAAAGCSSGSDGSSGAGGAPVGAAGSTAVASSPSGSAAGRSGEVFALTYNVAGLPQGLSSSDPTRFMPLIAPRLVPFDLVVTQEDFATPVPNPLPVGFFHEVLLAGTDFEYTPTPATPPVGTNPARPSALVADGLNYFSRYPVGEVTRVAWDGCFGGADTKDGGAADCLSMKGFAVAEISFAPGVDVLVVDLHGEAGGTAEDDRLSAADYEQLAAWLNANAAGRPVLLGGDTNLHTDRPEDGATWARFLTATGLTDVCDTVTCDDPDQIDKWAVRSGGGVTLEPLVRTVETERFAVPDGDPGPNDGQLSDHPAVSLRFRWTAA